MQSILVTRPVLATLIVASCLCLVLPSSAVLIYDREAILQGELWRLFSGHLIHFSLSHFILDLMALLLAYTLIEKRKIKNLEKILLCATVTIGPALFLFEPLLSYYAGMSGLSSAALFFSLLQCYQKTSHRLFFSVAIGLCLVKCFLEFYFEMAFFATLPAVVKTVPLSHLVGYVVAAICNWSFRLNVETNVSLI